MKKMWFGIAASGNTPYTCEVMRLAQIKSSLSLQFLIMIKENFKLSDFSLY